MSSGIECAELWFNPEGEIGNTACMHRFAQNYPRVSRVLGVTGSVVRGAVKPLIFPLWAMVGCVALPLIGCVRLACGKAGSGAFKAALLCVGGLIFCGAFMYLSAFHFPLVVSTSIFVAAVVISITYHVYKSCERGRPLKAPVAGNA